MGQEMSTTNSRERNPEGPVKPPVPDEAPPKPAFPETLTPREEREVLATETPKTTTPERPAQDTQANPAMPKLSQTAGERLATQSYNVAVTHFNEGRFQESRAEFSKLGALTSYLSPETRASAQFFQAISIFNLKDYKEADKQLSAFVSSKEIIESTKPEVIALRQQAGFRRAEAAFIQQDWPEASKRLTEWLSDPQNQKLKEANWASLFLGSSLAEQGMKEQALEALGKITPDAPKEIIEAATVEKSRIISLSGDFRQAIAELEKIGDLTEDNRLKLAVLYRKAGDFEGAGKILAELGTSLKDKSLTATLETETQTLSMARAVVLSDSGKDAEAIALLTPLAAGPESEVQKQAAIYLTLAEARGLLSSGDYATAITKFDALIKLGPTSPTYNSALIGNAWSQFRNGSYPEAISGFKTIGAALENSPAGKEALQMATVLETRMAYDSARKSEQADLNASIEGYRKLLAAESDNLKIVEDGSVKGAVNNFKKTMLLAHISLAKHDKEQRPGAIARAETALKDNLSSQLALDTRFELCGFYSDSGEMRQVISHATEYEKLMTTQANISEEDFRRLSDIRLMRIRAEISGGDPKTARDVAQQVQKEVEKLPEVDRKIYAAEAVRLEADSKLSIARGVISNPEKADAASLDAAATLAMEVYTHEVELPSIPAAMLTLGDIYKLQGKAEEAQAMFQRIKVNYPNTPAAAEASVRLSSK